jgi:hypothetical protein
VPLTWANAVGDTGFESLAQTLVNARICWLFWKLLNTREWTRFPIDPLECGTILPLKAILAMHPSRMESSGGTHGNEAKQATALRQGRLGPALELGALAGALSGA